MSPAKRKPGRRKRGGDYQPPKAMSEYAARYGVHKATVARWAKAGVDLENPDAVAAYRGSKKQGRKSPTEDKSAAEAERYLPGALAAADGLEGGAAAALKRLEDAERASYAQFQAALAEGDGFQIKVARETWLKMGDSLRRYDATVAEARRAAGAVLPKSEVERILRVLAYYLRIAGRTLFIGAADGWAAEDRPELIAAEAEELLGEGLLLGVANLIATSEGGMAVPGWVAAALTSDLETFFAEVGPALENRTEALRQAAEILENARKNAPKK